MYLFHTTNTKSISLHKPPQTCLDYLYPSCTRAKCFHGCSQIKCILLTYSFCVEILNNFLGYTENFSNVALNINICM